MNEPQFSQIYKDFITIHNNTIPVSTKYPEEKNYTSRIWDNNGRFEYISFDIPRFTGNQGLKVIKQFAKEHDLFISIDKKQNNRYCTKGGGIMIIFKNINQYNWFEKMGELIGRKLIKTSSLYIKHNGEYLEWDDPIITDEFVREHFKLFKQKWIEFTEPKENPEPEQEQQQPEQEYDEE